MVKEVNIIRVQIQQTDTKILQIEDKVELLKEFELNTN